MTSFTERSIGYAFGLLGGALFGLAGIVSLLFGTVDLAIGHSFAAVSAWAEGIVLLVVAGLALFFAWLAHGPWKDQPVVSGLLLVIIAAIGWATLGLGGSILALLGALFVFLAGVLYLVEPVRMGIRAAATA